MAEPDYRVLFERLPGLYLVLDPGLRIVAASDAYLEATLTVREGIVGRHLFEVFPDNPGDPSADAIRNTRASLQRVLQTRRPDSMVVQRHDVRRSEEDGGGFELRYWSPTNSPILGPDGSIAYLLHRVENVTEFVLGKEQDLARSRQSDVVRRRAVRTEADLDARSREVAQTSLELKLANERLAALYANSRDLVELKNRFFADISHELRTPLTLILAPLERLLDGPPLPPEIRYDLEGVQRSAQLLQRHVADVLDIAKLEAGQLLVHYARADLASLVRMAASHFQRPAAQRQIRLEVDAPRQLDVEVDADKVERILLNLLSNALKFTPDGGHISLTLRATDRRALIGVEDDGPGVPEPLRDAVFERFRQGDEGPERRHGGTGLGLAIVREFALLHRGSAAAAESPSGGARFTIELPLRAPSDVHVSETGRPGDGARQPTQGLAPQPARPRGAPVPMDVAAPHVLVVEDDVDMNALLTQALGRHYWVSRAFDGREGVRRALLPDRPDLIVADLMLPGMNGVAMVEELRRHVALEDVPVIILTAMLEDRSNTRLLRQGVLHYVQKPFSVEALLARVHSLLADRRRAGRLREREERYRALFESIDEGFCIIQMIYDESGKAIDYLFVETNPAFELQAGLADVQGKRIRELAPDMEEHWFEIYGRVALTGEPRRFESRSELMQRWFNAYAFRYGSPENRQVAVLFKDITARKQGEEALRESDRRKSQFLALLAHELRNPLAPIRNGVQILRMSPAGNIAPANRLVPMMERQLSHIARLLDDLLDVSRIAHGRIELRKERVALGDVVQTAIEANQPLIEAKGHELSISLSSHPLMLDADPVRLTQVVSNLLNNAVHYSPPGARIDLSAEQEGAEVRLAVKDSGHGIRPEDLDGIFELFVQVGPQFARSQGGLGVGLSLVRTLVDLHGGRVEARSGGPGHGSEFIVRLPAPPGVHSRGVS